MRSENVKNLSKPTENDTVSARIERVFHRIMLLSRGLNHRSGVAYSGSRHAASTGGITIYAIRLWIRTVRNREASGSIEHGGNDFFADFYMMRRRFERDSASARLKLTPRRSPDQYAWRWNNTFHTVRNRMRRSSHGFQCVM